jgi:hypothetical protein
MMQQMAVCTPAPLGLCALTSCILLVCLTRLAQCCMLPGVSASLSLLSIRAAGLGKICRTKQHQAHMPQPPGITRTQLQHSSPMAQQHQQHPQQPDRTHPTAVMLLQMQRKHSNMGAATRQQLASAMQLLMQSACWHPLHQTEATLQVQALALGCSRATARASAGVRQQLSKLP